MATSIKPRGRKKSAPRPLALDVAVAGSAAEHLTLSVVIHRADPDETGYWAEVPALPGCVTQGETLDETLANARDAIEGHIETLVSLGQPLPRSDQPAVVPVTVRVPVAR